jgi:non-heme chloroperoxidase
MFDVIREEKAMEEFDRERRGFLKASGAVVVAAVAANSALAQQSEDAMQGSDEDADSDTEEQMPGKEDPAPAAKEDAKPAAKEERVKEEAKEETKAATKDAKPVARKESKVTVDDGTQLHVIEAGKGQPIIMIPGWSQTAAMYKHQIDALSDKYRCIAVDMRGHGESDKPPHGYRIQRLAADIRALIYYQDLEDVVLMGHSMGCSVIWSYWDMFSGDRVSKVVLIDQAPTVTAQNGWTDEQKIEAGTLFDPKTLYDTVAAIGGPDGAKASEDFIRGPFFTKNFPAEELDWVVKENLKMPRRQAADLMLNHCSQDWRDVIPRIDKPTLVVGAEKSFFNPKSQQWIAKQIKGAKAEIFAEADGGSHFMFMENPEKFNKLAREFLG